jgi:hypothetical protein
MRFRAAGPLKRDDLRTPPPHLDPGLMRPVLHRQEGAGIQIENEGRVRVLVVTANHMIAWEFV